MQWEADRLDLNDAIKAWEGYIAEHKAGDGHTTTERHGAWVPAIPL